MACAVAALALPLHASSARFFQAATQSDFLKGDVENLSIDGRGELALGPATELVYETSAPFLWSVVGLPDGTLFAGTGNEGKVFKIDAQGRGSVFFDSPELEVHALAAAPGGGLFVGTSPDGKIYQVDRNGTSKVIFTNDEKYIWALAVDKRGNLFAGTGDKGIVYKITPDGKSAPFYKTNATHATALAFDPSGNLLVGTSTPGRVLRVDGEGKAFLLLDSPFQEIRSLRFDDKGVLYVAALNGRAGSAPSSTATDTSDHISVDTGRGSMPVPSVSAEITSISIVDVGGSPPGPAPREDHRTARGAVYRITPDGVWDEVWESREDSPYDLAFEANGALLVGTGNKGKVYRLEGEPLRPTLLARASAQQVTTFFRDGTGRLLYATANPGKLFRLSSAKAARGTYESESHDAQVVATWGALSWRGTTPPGSKIELFTRTGNTETPDETWSAWSPAYTKAEGSAISSPKARYIQWRAVLTGQSASPVLTSVTAAYLQRNLRPQVRSITIHPPGIVFQKPYSTGDPELAGFEDQSTPDRKLAAQAAAQSSGGAGSLGRRTYQKGLQTIAWRADDENDDELIYDVLYRREGESTWKVLRKGVQETILVWDTTTVPNGTYFVRIVASDSPSNPPAEALSGEADSIAFEIDNTPPTVTIGTVRSERGRTVISFDVNDDHSPILRVEYSQDGQRWRPVFPVDGIADSRSEHYELSIEGDLGERGVTLRATDSMNNVASAQVEGRRR
jgi:hypothetical protein